MYAFTYHRPSTVDEAAALLAKYADAKLMAGGQTLLPAMKLRLRRARPTSSISASCAQALSGITEEGGSIVIGAMTRHGEIATSDLLKRAIPALAGMAGVVGDPAVRSRGTMGGSLANNDPAADYPAACLALGATIAPTSARSQADDFFLGLFETALREGEIITKILSRCPKRPATRSSAIRPRATPWSACSWPSARTARAGHGDGRRRQRRVPGHGFRGGARGASSASRDRGRQGLAERAQLRHPCRCRLPGASHRRDCAPSSRRGGALNDKRFSAQQGLGGRGAGSGCVRSGELGEQAIKGR